MNVSLEPNWLEITCTWRQFKQVVLQQVCTPVDIVNKQAWILLRQRLLTDENPSIRQKLQIISTGNTSWRVTISFILSQHTNTDQLVFDLPYTAIEAGLVTREIDARSPLASAVLEHINQTGRFPVNYKTLLATLGSRTWTKDTFSLQCKLNEVVYAKLFEQSCKNLGVTYKQVDPYGDYLYCGSPGNVCDYLVYTDKTRLNSIRVELKMLKDTSVESIERQNLHDGQVCFVVGFSQGDYKSKLHILDSDIDLAFVTSLNEEFNKVLYNKKQAGVKLFLGIKNFDDTGKLDFYRF